ncbi:aldehyde dehydrogenase [Arthrobacter sp. AZCC_0090]|uniref:aldehyde dehydrogenase family protein n=1 Tax=Arthrobacter sp. AZCC_0090 TaxID=2735881 RepID=UPI0021AA3448|nr:aldehyde dehydrogenase family protein [Arthrobacter sp. AZCC_0090]
MLDTHSKTDLLQGAIVVGDDIRLEGEGRMTHVNPATGREQADFPQASARDVDDAVVAARAAQPVWAGLPAARRQEILRNLSRLMVEQADEFATINALETGTPYAGFRSMIVNRFPAWFDYYAGWIEKLHGDTIDLDPGRAFLFTTKEPVGVVAKILTWNGPLNNIYMAVAPALAAGCAVVIKPPELAPFGAIRFGKLCREAGFPAGTVSVLPGGAATGDALTRHPGIDKISFTGGPATARIIGANTAQTITPLVLELGGKSAHIVFPDADLDSVVAQQTAFCRLAGQVCTSPTRLLVHDEIYDETVARVKAAYEAITVGDPFDPNVIMGPVISEGARDRILGMIDRALADGATLATGGGRLGGDLADGFFVPPTLLTNAAHDSEISQEEVFGPVVTISRFSTAEEAIAIANDSQFGLAGFVHTRDINKALWAASKLDAGTIGINGGASPASYAAPFGGVRNSGYGREGGREGIEEFLRVKTINVALS